ncbi:hypothetical protein [Hansschlegelia zhihuaiae]|uniref:Uracil-DNA glycosylase-like domain-containing protein n=1 Tax=Hansschlegelia zhihuaiae TaxID=405005 RepID=A0A4Q0M601_9HYPH|nr:hypothetical protein [Hansschlegelia zhihuaiae]RXF68253.1 hypothetical protein EK403_20365 [Hansschlegelia zhihuaiae]
MKNRFAAPLVDFWSQLKGEIHPDDAPFRGQAPNEINFDYPPPAFTGDIANARIVVLMANGGYDPQTTPREFLEPNAADRWRAALCEPRPSDPRWTSPYYLRGRLGEWLRSGRAVAVNALAYRSVKVTDAVRRFAAELPSSRFHREWLHGSLRMAAEAGDVRVVIHRSGLWRPSGEIRSNPNIRVLAGAEPARRYLSKEVVTWAERSPEPAPFKTRP